MKIDHTSSLGESTQIISTDLLCSKKWTIFSFFPDYNWYENSFQRYTDRYIRLKTDGTFINLVNFFQYVTRKRRRSPERKHNLFNV